MIRVLVVTYYWPPSGGPGVQRWLKFVKYLPQFGIDPIVLTVDPLEATYPVADHTLALDIPHNVKVFHTSTLEPYALYKRLFRKKQVPYSGFTNEAPQGFLNSIARFIRGNLFVPDARKGWNRFAVRKALELIEEYNIQTIITTSPPHSSQLIGLQVKKVRPDIQWIVDLRDPWTDIFYYKKMLHLPHIKKKDAHLEQQVLMKADNVVTVSNYLKSGFLSRLSAGRNRHIEVITNGYDPADFPDRLPAPKFGEFTIAYTGTISDEYDLSGFIAAWKLAKQKITIPFQMNFIGNVSSFWKERIIMELDQDALFVNHVSHSEAIQYMYRANLLLLLIPCIEGNKGIVTGKVFEYIAAQQPVLGIGPVDGDAASILEESGTGQLFHYSDTEGIARFIMKVMQGEMQISARPEQYSRIKLTQKLAQIINERKD